MSCYLLSDGRYHRSKLAIINLYDELSSSRASDDTVMLKDHAAHIYQLSKHQLEKLVDRYHRISYSGHVDDIRDDLYKFDEEV